MLYDIIAIIVILIALLFVGKKFFGKNKSSCGCGSSGSCSEKSKKTKSSRSDCSDVSDSSGESDSSGDD